MIFFDLHTHKIGGNDASIYNASYTSIPKEVDFSLSFHPWEEFPFINYSELFDFAQRISDYKNWKAIGECGLDYKRGHHKPEQQKEHLRWQLELSSTFHKPIIIHCVKAWYDLWPMFKNSTSDKIIHAFLPSDQNTSEVLKDPKTYVSIGLRETKHPNFSRAIQKIPINRIFAETDNQSIEVIDVYKAIAQSKEVSLEDLVKAISNTRQCIFGI